MNLNGVQTVDLTIFCPEHCKYVLSPIFAVFHVAVYLNLYLNHNKVEYQLSCNRISTLFQAVHCGVELIAKLKYFSKNEAVRLKHPLTNALTQITGYNQLLRQVECVRAQKYDQNNQEHEASLLKVSVMFSRLRKSHSR